MKKLLLFILIVSPILSRAQTISGRVLDENSAPLPFANVALCSATDSSVIAGVTTNSNGAFSLANQSNNKSFLRISFVGYQTNYSEALEQPLEVRMKPLQLQEVVAVAHKKLFEQRGGEMIANVSGTILQTFPKTSEVIAQLPFVSADNNNFTVFGKGTPVIYINNRPIQDVSELDRLLPTDIKEIKVNTMPGAKYDSTVGAVIEIITEKPQGEGLSGSLFACVKRSAKWSAEEYASLNYRRGAWDVFGSAYLIQSNSEVNTKSQQQLKNLPTLQEVSYLAEEDVNSKMSIATAGINYNPSENISAGVRYEYNGSSWDDETTNEIKHTADNATTLMQQFANMDCPSDRHNLNGYFIGDLSEALSLDMNVDWIDGNENYDMNSWFNEESNGQDVNTLYERNYGLFSSKGVLTYSGEVMMIEGGGEYSFTDMEQNYDIDNTSLGLAASRDLTEQNRWALFVSTEFQFEVWGFGLGLRYEDVDFDYFENDVLNNEQSREYHRLFPNISAQFAQNGLQVALSYERKIDFPSYNSLRSNVQYSSPYVYESGNPLLSPEIENAITCMGGFGNLRMMLGYSWYEHYITQSMDMFNNQPVVLMRPENVDNVKRFFATLNYTAYIGPWRPSLEVGLDKQYLTLQSRDFDKPTYSVSLNNSFSFPGEWYFNANVGWDSEGHSGIYLYKSSFNSNIGLSKWMFDDKLALSLRVNDIFKTGNDKWEVDNTNVWFDNDKYQDSRYIRFAIQYTFNSTRNKYEGGSFSDETKRL